MERPTFATSRHTFNWSFPSTLYSNERPVDLTKFSLTGKTEHKNEKRKRLWYVLIFKRNGKVPKGLERRKRSLLRPVGIFKWWWKQYWPKWIPCCFRFATKSAPLANTSCDIPLLATSDLTMLNQVDCRAPARRSWTVACHVGLAVLQAPAIWIVARKRLSHLAQRLAKLDKIVLTPVVRGNRNSHKI